MGISTELAHVKKLIREYYKQHYAYQLSDLDETDQFLKNCKLPKLTQDEIENLINPIVLI